MRFWGTLILSVLVVTPAAAQVVGHIVSVSPVTTTYGAVKPPCAAGDGKTPDMWYGRALTTWEKMNDGNENMYLCAVRAAQAGHRGAEELLGRIYSQPRVTSAGYVVATVIPDPESALYWFTKAADAGNGMAAAEIGTMYDSGNGVPQDDAQAATWYERAISLNYGSARGLLKTLQDRPARIADFDSKYRARAEAGDGQAGLAMSDAYAHGVPYIKDSDQALSWLTKAAEAGYGPAQSRLGEKYIDGDGDGVKADLPTACEWLIKAARNGDHDHDADLVVLYNGGTLPQGTVEQIQSLAADGLLYNAIGKKMKFKPGKSGDQALAAQPEPAPPPPSLARLTSDAQHGDARAQFELGERYLAGDGVTADPATAKSWFEKAAPQISEADMNLGDMAYGGQGGPVDKALAAQWYAAAAVMDDSLGAKNAAIIYMTPDSGSYDLVKAYGMALKIQMNAWENDHSLLTTLRPKLPPEQRAEALAWLSELTLAHAKHITW